MLKQTLLKLLDLRCPGCEQPSVEGGLCSVCQSFLTVHTPACPHCARPLQTDEPCGLCLQRPPPWQRLHCVWVFDGLCRFLIHRFKYQHDLAAGTALIHLWLAHRHDVDPPLAITAVPMHAQRQHQRGFNPAEWLARQFCRHLKIPYWSGLQRRTPTPLLEGLNRRQRRQALQGAFHVKSTPPSGLVLVDDVLTSGATLGELSRSLIRAGGSAPHVWVLARTPRPEENR